MITTLGQRIKSLRRERNLTLAEMAERSSLSASHLSQVEQDKSMPSLATLTRIAEILEINPRDLLESGPAQVHLTRAGPLAGQVGTAAPAFSLPLTSSAAGSALEVQKLTLQPQAPGLQFEPYPGEVLGFVLQGRLEITIESERMELGAGDSIHYDGNQAYCLRCQGDEPCRLIWCSSPPRLDLASESDLTTLIKKGEEVT